MVSQAHFHGFYRETQLGRALGSKCFRDGRSTRRSPYLVASTGKASQEFVPLGKQAGRLYDEIRPPSQRSDRSNGTARMRAQMQRTVTRCSRLVSSGAGISAGLGELMFRCQCSDLRVQVHQEQTPCPLEVLMHRIHSNHNKGDWSKRHLKIQGKKSQKFDPRREVGWFLGNVGCLTCAGMTTTAIGRSTLSTQPLSLWSVLPRSAARRGFWEFHSVILVRTTCLWWRLATTSRWL